MRKLFLVMASTALTSCTVVGPDYARPDIVVPEAFALTTPGPVISAAEMRWWDDLGDPMLTKMLERGLAQNLDVRIARERIIQSASLLRVASPENQLLSGNIQAAKNRTRTEGVTVDSQRFSFGPSFVLDFFGGATRQAEAAQADFEASVFDQDTARLAFQAALVNRYLDARYFQEAINLRQQSISNRRKVLKSLQIRQSAGEETSFALRRAEAELQFEASALPELRSGLNSAAFALATLLAEQGGAVLAELSSGPKRLPRPSAKVAPGAPAALLQNRPDVRAAEARLRSSVADIGVAQSELYPTIQLSGTLTGGSVHSSVFGPSLSMPVLNRGLLLARRNASISVARQNELEWRATVGAAIEEVQSNMSRFDELGKQVRSLSRAVSTYRDAMRLSNEAFSLNAITLVDLLDAEADLSNATLRLADARRNYAATWAELNIALGNGWAVLGPDPIVAAEMVNRDLIGLRIKPAQ